MAGTTFSQTKIKQPFFCYSQDLLFILSILYSEKIDLSIQPIFIPQTL